MIPFGDIPPESPSSRSLAAAAASAFVLLLAPGAGGQPAPPPPISILQDSGSLASGYIFIGPQAVNVANPVQGPEIIDSQGRVVWFQPSPPSLTASDFRVQTYMGNPVLTWSQSSAYDAPTPATTVDYVLDATYSVVATVKAGNGFNADMHEFQLTPQNTALIAINDAVQADLSSVGGPASGSVDEGSVQEIDVATGAVLFQWHSLDYVPLSESHYAYTPGQTAPYDYFHINSVKLDTDGNILVSSRHTWTVYKLNRTTGAVIWRLGGKSSDFALGAGLPFAWQHDVEAVDAQTLRIFDNESDGAAVLPYSRVIWVQHDDSAMTASVVQTLVHPDDLSVYAEGNAQTLANGDTFVDWGVLGRFSEFTGAGQLLYDAEEAGGYASYRGFRFPWTGSPTGVPTALVLQNSDGTLAVHAVWNGATAVASWEVLAAVPPATPGPVATVPWNGLDTEATIPAGATAVQVVALDSTGAVIATSATASAPFAPVFPGQPASQTVASGGSVVLGVTASGAAPAYQWLFNGSPIADGAFDGATVSGATGPTLLITGATAANAGAYACVATSFGNSSTSDAALLSVDSTADAARLVDASCRAPVGTGEANLIMGFAVGGQAAAGTEPVLLRASGPALAQFGVAGVLPDPALQLVGAGGLLASDAGWDGSPQIAATAEQVGAFQWSNPSSLDSAIAASLPAGTYSAVIFGASGDTGVALGEVYDASQAGLASSTAPRLVNLSARAQVGTGAGILIAGFVVGGSTSEAVLIRASGPALGAFGVTGALADPRLQLYRQNADGTATLMDSDEGWNGDSEIAGVAASVGAFPWGSSATADSALLVSLPPGTYTAEVSGVSGDTGISLVELFEVP